MAVALVAFPLLFAPTGVVRSLHAKRIYDCDAPENRGKPSRVEMTLSKKWRKKGKEIKQAFRSASEAISIRIDFFPFLDPPMNIAIGKCVPAEEARLGIRQAIRYNRGVELLVLQDVVPHHWIGIGTTKLSELSWIAIRPEELDHLLDPTLSTEQFHRLYRELARMTEKKQPFGMDPIPLDPAPPSP